MEALWNWAQHVHGKRIAIVNFFVQYPLYGNHLSNYVQYVARRSSDGKSSDIGSCTAWRQALNDGRYDYVIVTNPDYPFPSKAVPAEVAWTQSDAATNLLLQKSDSSGTHVWLFEIDGKLDPRGCAVALSTTSESDTGKQQTRRVITSAPVTSEEGR
jgi:hypothetical protein